jgi:hypothetical protein
MFKPSQAANPHFSYSGGRNRSGTLFLHFAPVRRRKPSGLVVGLGKCGLKQNRQAVLILARISSRSSNAELMFEHRVASLARRV